MNSCACLKPESNGEFCGRCEVCLTFSRNAYPELFMIRPESKSRQIVIGKDQTDEGIRRFNYQLGLTAAAGWLKFGLILEADRMNENAQNAFLKTLEEPPGGTMLLLLTCHPGQLLPTIRSRCQNLHLYRNHHTYENVMALGLFPLLATMQRGAGAATALAAAFQLRTILGRLLTEVEMSAGEIDPRLLSQAEQDKNLAKALAEEKETQLRAAYLARRQEVLDAIQVWFQQQALMASGVDRAALPHPEILEAAGINPDAPASLSWIEADRGARLAGELVHFLAGNVDERLCLEAFSLAVCERASPPSPQKRQSVA